MDAILLHLSKDEVIDASLRKSEDRVQSLLNQGLCDEALTLIDRTYQFLIENYC